MQESYIARFLCPWVPTCCLQRAPPPRCLAVTAHLGPQPRKGVRAPLPHPDDACPRNPEIADLPTG